LTTRTKNKISPFLSFCFGERFEKKGDGGLIGEEMKENINEEKQEWLTTDEAAEFLKVSAGCLRNLTSNGQVPFYKFGKRNRYLKSELHEMLLSEKRGRSVSGY
jgi:excisionase family DNA binding protein